MSKLSVYKIKDNLFIEVYTFTIQKNITVIIHILKRKIHLSSAVFGYNFLPSYPCLTILIKFTNVSLKKTLPVYYLDEQSRLSTWKEPQSQGIQWSSSNTSCMGLWYPKSSNHSNSQPAVTSLNCPDSPRSILFSQHKTSDFKCLEPNSKEPSPELTGLPCSPLNLQVKKSCNFLLNYKFDCCDFFLLSLHAPKRECHCSGAGSGLAHSLVNQAGHISPTSLWTPTFEFWASV